MKKHQEIVDSLDDSLCLLLNIKEEAKIIAQQKYDRELNKIVNQLDIITERLINVNLIDIQTILK